MVSPSSRRLNLMVPCDAGWDGPIWISMTSLAPRSVSSNRSGMRDPGVCGMSAALPRIPRVADGIALRHERLPLVHRVVLAQRVTLELRIHEDAPQVGMADEADAEAGPPLALRPQRRLPQRRDARDARVVAGDRRLHAQAMVLRQAVQVVDDLEARLASQVVDRRQIRQSVEAEHRVVAQRAQAVEHVLAREDDDGRAARLLRGPRPG